MSLIDDFVGPDGLPATPEDPSRANAGSLNWGNVDGLPAAYGYPQRRIVAAGIPSAEDVGEAVVEARIVAAGIPSAEDVGEPTVTASAASHTIVCGAIASTAAVGQPIIGGAPSTHTIVCTAIPSAESVGRPILGAPPPRGSVRPPDMELEQLLARLRAQALREDGELLLFAAELVCAAD